MILIDGSYINYGGGKVLLEYLIKSLIDAKVNFHFLIDNRLKGQFEEISNEKKTFIKPSFVNRFNFYKNNSTRFSKVLCFGNIPPPIRLNAIVYTYFHQTMFLEIPKEIGFIQSLKIRIKSFVFKQLIKNSDYWMVQTYIIRNSLSNKYSINHTEILVLPFYPRLEYRISNRVKCSFVYVSDVSPHKNHKLLIETFCAFYDKHKIGELVVTVSNKYQDMYNLIEEKCKKGYPIQNIGFVNRDHLGSIYSKSEYMIYPSSTESFGLGIVEAIECGCKIIGPNLPYMLEVCNPSILFDLSSNSLMNAFEQSIGETKKSEQKVFNEVNELINCLKYE